MPARKHKNVDKDTCLYPEGKCANNIILEHPESDSWLRADAEDGCVTFDSSDMDGKPRLDADGLECLIDWLTERWNELEPEGE